MQHWSAIRWGATVSTRGEKAWVELPNRYALIGSHPRCDIQIEGNRIPSVAYLAVICADRIEAWPVCAIAFPVWGVLEESAQILVGKSRIQFSSESSASWPEAKTSQPGDALNDAGAIVSAPPPPNASLFFDWGKGSREKPLNRRVSILGDDHPSLIRMHRVGLRQCDQGIVCLDRHVWMIELHPERLQPNMPLVRRLDSLEAPVELGRTKIWAGRPANPHSNHDEFTDASDSDANLLDSGEVFPVDRGEQVISRPTEPARGLTQNNKASSGAMSRQASSRETAQRDAACEKDKGRATAQQRSSRSKATNPSLADSNSENITFYPGPGNLEGQLPGSPVEQPTESKSATQPNSEEPKGTPEKLGDSVSRLAVSSALQGDQPGWKSNLKRRSFDRSNNEVETLVTEFTDRLLSTTTQKDNQRRKSLWGIRIAVAVAALATVAAIVAFGVAPILRSIYLP